MMNELLKDVIARHAVEVGEIPECEMKRTKKTIDQICRTLGDKTFRRGPEGLKDVCCDRGLNVLLDMVRGIIRASSLGCRESARQAGVGRTSMAKFVRGDVGVSFPVLVKICAMVDLHINLERVYPGPRVCVRAGDWHR